MSMARLSHKVKENNNYFKMKDTNSTSKEMADKEAQENSGVRNFEPIPRT